LKQRADTSDADDKPRKLMLKKNIKRLERPSNSSQILSVSEVRTESHDEAPEVWNFYRSAPSSDLGIDPDYPANGVLLLNQMGWMDSNLPQRPVTPLQYAQSVVTPQNYTQSDYFDPFDSTQPTGFSFGGAPSIGYEIGSIGASDRAPAQDENQLQLNIGHQQFLVVQSISNFFLLFCSSKCSSTKNRNRSSSKINYHQT